MMEEEHIAVDNEKAFAGGEMRNIEILKASGWSRGTRSEGVGLSTPFMLSSASSRRMTRTPGTAFQHPAVLAPGMVPSSWMTTDQARSVAKETREHPRREAPVFAAVSTWTGTGWGSSLAKRPAPLLDARQGAVEMARAANRGADRGAAASRVRPTWREVVGANGTVASRSAAASPGEAPRCDR